MMIMIRKCPPCENWPDQKYTCGKYNERPKEDILRMLGKLKKEKKKNHVNNNACLYYYLFRI